MIDRVFSNALGLTVLSLISACAMGSLLLVNSGLLEILAGHAAGGSARVALGVAVGVASYRLCRHRHELADS
jgi:hypothetical protein